MTASWLFSGWDFLARIAVVGTLTYVGVVFVLRWAGNRTLAKSAAFDHVVTVAFGSILATTLLSRDASLADGLVAFFVLVILQFAVAWLISRSRRIQSLVVHRPVVLVHHGVLQENALKRARVSKSDVHAAVRKQGLGRMEEVALVVMESDGTFSVIRQTDLPFDAIEGIQNQIPNPQETSPPFRSAAAP